MFCSTNANVNNGYMVLLDTSTELIYCQQIVWPTNGSHFVSHSVSSYIALPALFNCKHIEICHLRTLNRTNKKYTIIIVITQLTGARPSISRVSFIATTRVRPRCVGACGIRITRRLLCTFINICKEVAYSIYKYSL